MKKFHALYFVFCMLTGITLSAQKPDRNGYAYSVDNDFLIIATVKDFHQAEKLAMEAALKLKIAYHSRGMFLDSIGRLTYPPDTCKALGRDPGYPCEIIRGLRGVKSEEQDNGIYITIEPTYLYLNLTKGYYAIVAGSGDAGDKTLRVFLKEAKKVYQKCYIKRTVLYGDGCSN